MRTANSMTRKRRMGSAIRLGVCILLLSGATSSFGDNLSMRAGSFEQLARELILIQERMLSATIPRPTGEAVTNDCEEIVRRMEIIIRTWDDMVRGKAAAKKDAQDRTFQLKSSMPLNGAERRYACALSTRLGIHVEAVEKPVTNLAELIYIYGYNKQMADFLRQRYAEDVFFEILETSVDNYQCSEGGLFFIPWRFSFGLHSISQVAGDECGQGAVRAGGN